MYSNEYEDEQEQGSNGNFIINFYNNNKILVWIFAGIIIFILLMSLLTRGGSNNRNANINYDVSIIPEGDVFVLLGKSTNLIASVKNDTKAEFVWSVEDETIAKVDNGNVTGLDYGTTTVTATYIDSKNEKHTDSRKVTVAEGDPSITLSDVSFKEGDLFMPVNETYPIALTLTPSRGYVESEKFTSSNTNVVTVDNRGVVTAVGEGSAVVTFDVNNGQFRKELNVYVDRDFNRTEIIVTPSKITFDGELRKIKVGTIEKLSYTIEPENAASDKFTWESSDESILTVDDKGKVKGISEGMAVVTVTALNGTKDRIDVEVESDIVQVTDINLTINDLYLTAGQSQIIVPSVSPANASNKALSYMSLDPSVAYVTPNETGTQATITGINAGTTTIVVKSFNDIERRLTVVVTGGQGQGGSGGGSGSGSGGGSSSSNQGFNISSSDIEGKGYVNATYDRTRPIDNCAKGPVNVTVTKTSSSVKKLVVLVCEYPASSNCGDKGRYETTDSTSFTLGSGDYIIRVEEYNSSNTRTRVTDKFICIDGGSTSSSLYTTNKTLYSTAALAQSNSYAKGTIVTFNVNSSVGYIKVCESTSGLCTESSATKVTSSKSITFNTLGQHIIRVFKYSNGSSTASTDLRYVYITNTGTGTKDPKVLINNSSSDDIKLTTNVGEKLVFQEQAGVEGTFANRINSTTCLEWFDGQNYSSEPVQIGHPEGKIPGKNLGIPIRSKTCSIAEPTITVTFTPKDSSYQKVVKTVKVIINNGSTKKDPVVLINNSSAEIIKNLSVSVGGKVVFNERADVEGEFINKINNPACLEWYDGKDYGREPVQIGHPEGKVPGKNMGIPLKGKNCTISEPSVTVTFTPKNSAYRQVVRTVKIKLSGGGNIAKKDPGVLINNSSSPITLNLKVGGKVTFQEQAAIEGTFTNKINHPSCLAWYDSQNYGTEKIEKNSAQGKFPGKNLGIPLKGKSCSVSQPTVTVTFTPKKELQGTYDTVTKTVKINLSK